jgi:hypothetical protein
VPNITTYTLEIEREQAGAAPWQITQTLNTNSFQLGGLSASTRYKFKVRSNCPGGGHSNWTKWYKFKTADSWSNNPGGSNLDDQAANRFDNQDGKLAMQIFPNPAQGFAAVRLRNLNLESAALRLLDAAGRIVQENQIQSQTGTWEGELNLVNLPNGLYMLQIRSGESAQNARIVVAK